MKGPVAENSTDGSLSGAPRRSSGYAGHDRNARLLLLPEQTLRRRQHTSGREDRRQPLRGREEGVVDPTVDLEVAGGQKESACNEQGNSDTTDGAATCGLLVNDSTACRWRSHLRPAGEG